MTKPSMPQIEASATPPSWPNLASDQHDDADGEGDESDQR
jgi:hypothetical protein